MYNILWLDDDFAEVKDPMACDAITLRRLGFQEDASNAEIFGFNVDKAIDFEEFKIKYTANSQKYQVIILDIKELNPEDPTDDGVIYKIRDLISSNKSVLSYIYSGNTDKEAHKYFLETYFKDRAFNKGDTSNALFLKIKEDLCKLLHCYAGHEECLCLYNEGYLCNTKQRMDTLVTNYNDKKQGNLNTYFPYNDMRVVLEDMLDTLQNITGDIPAGIIDNDDYLSFNKKIRYISIDCEKDPETHEVLWDKPKFPYTKCRHEIKNVINFLGNITNRYSHYVSNSPSYLLSGEELSAYNMPIQEATYTAFFVVMKWFYGYMKSKNID